MEEEKECKLIFLYGDKTKESVFHCHLSSDTTQNAATTHTHMETLIKKKMLEGTLL